MTWPFDGLLYCCPSSKQMAASMRWTQPLAKDTRRTHKHICLCIASMLSGFRLLIFSQVIFTFPMHFPFCLRAKHMFHSFINGVCVCVWWLRTAHKSIDTRAQKHRKQQLNIQHNALIMFMNRVFRPATLVQCCVCWKQHCPTDYHIPAVLADPSWHR